MVMDSGEYAPPVEAMTVYWCKDRRGIITERITTPYEGHRGHVRCVPVGEAG